MVNLGAFRAELERRGFKTSYFDTAGQASDYLDQALDGRTIGFGGSQTVRDMGLYERLALHNTCIWHWGYGEEHDPQGRHRCPGVHLFPQRRS